MDHVCQLCHEPLEEPPGLHINGTLVGPTEHRREQAPPKGLLCLDCQLDARKAPKTAKSDEDPGIPTEAEICDLIQEQAHNHTE